MYGDRKLRELICTGTDRGYRKQICIGADSERECAEKSIICTGGMEK